MHLLKLTHRFVESPRLLWRPGCKQILEFGSVIRPHGFFKPKGLPQQAFHQPVHTGFFPVSEFLQSGGSLRFYFVNGK